MQNVKPVLKVKEGKPIINFMSLRDINKDEELLYDYSDNSQSFKDKFSMANPMKYRQVFV